MQIWIDRHMSSRSPLLLIPHGCCFHNAGLSFAFLSGSSFNRPSPPLSNSVLEWNRLISENTKRGHGREALNLYKEMREEGVIPNTYTFIAVSKACSTIPDLQSGKLIHAHALKSGYYTDISIANTLIHMYAKCGNIEEARLVFDNMKHRNIVSWNSLIVGYAHMQMGEPALALYARMPHEGLTPDSVTYIGLLKACGSLAVQNCRRVGGDEVLKKGYLEQVRGIHAELVKQGLHSDLFVATTLIDMYSKFGCMEDARQVFENTRNQNVVCWNAIISGYARSDMGNSALELYTRMQCEGIVPDDRTFLAALKACASQADKEDNGQLKTSYLAQGRAIHAKLVKIGLESDIFVASTLIDMYAKYGSIEDALQIFEKMTHRNVVSWNAMITGYAHMNMGDLALEFYARMQHEGFTPDSCTFIAVLKACSSLAAEEHGKGVEGKLKKTCYLEQGRAIHAQIAKSGFESDIFVASTLVDMYAKCGSIEDARLVFEKMKHRNTVSWNSMIIGYAQMEMGNLALDLYLRMQHEGFTPDACTFVATLKACTSLAAQEESKEVEGKLVKTCSLDQGKAIHAELAKRGFESNTFVANTLVDMYVKCGSIEEARSVFENMENRDVISWNIIVTGYAQMEMGNVALELHARMRDEGFAANARTFVALLKACSNLAALKVKGVDNEHVKTSYLEQGRTIHVELAKRGFESNLHIARSLVDMYVKCGSIEDARRIFGKMTHRDVVSWNAMITGYAQMGMVDSAFRLYACMQHEGVTPDANTFVAALKACANLAVKEENRPADEELLKTSYLDQGRAIHAELARRGFNTDIYIANVLIDMYAKCGSIEDARLVFDMMNERDVVSWTAMILGYAQKEMVESAMELYTRMKHEGFIPDPEIFVVALKACGSLASLETGKRIDPDIQRINERVSHIHQIAS